MENILKSKHFLLFMAKDLVDLCMAIVSGAACVSVVYLKIKNSKNEAYEKIQTLKKEYKQGVDIKRLNEIHKELDNPIISLRFLGFFSKRYNEAEAFLNEVEKTQQVYGEIESKLVGKYYEKIQQQLRTKQTKDLNCILASLSPNYT